MFEKEADSYANGFLKLLDWKQFDQHDKVIMFSAFKDGAEFGYNKAKKDINVEETLLSNNKRRQSYSCVLQWMYSDMKAIYTLEKLIKLDYSTPMIADDEKELQ